MSNGCIDCGAPILSWAAGAYCHAHGAARAFARARGGDEDAAAERATARQRGALAS